MDNYPFSERPLALGGEGNFIRDRVGRRPCWTIRRALVAQRRSTARVISVQGSQTRFGEDPRQEPGALGANRTEQAVNATLRTINEMIHTPSFFKDAAE